MAEREVRLNRAKWIGPSRIRLRFDPFAYRYIRLKILSRDGYVCYWCGSMGTTIDHVIPWSKGGRTTMTNCICACQECNGLRGDMDATKFARLRGLPYPDPYQLAAPKKVPEIQLVRLGSPQPTLKPKAEVAVGTEPALDPAPSGPSVTSALLEPSGTTGPRRRKKKRSQSTSPGRHTLHDLLDPNCSQLEWRSLL